MEFEITTDLSVIPQEIDFNFEEIKSELAEKLDLYNHLVITPESIKSAKQDKAKLNKLYKAIEDKRKEVKAKCLEPYNAFEAKVKEITAMIQKPIHAIDTQLKAFADKAAEEKHAVLEEYFKSIYDGNFIEFDKILNPKWANSTAKVELLEEELKESVDRINFELANIEMQYGDKPYFIAVKNTYQATNYNLSETLAYATRLEADFAERERRKEQQKQEKGTAPAQEAKTETTVKKWVGFAALLDVDDARALKEFFKSRGIQYKSLGGKNNGSN